MSLEDEYKAAVKEAKEAFEDSKVKCAAYIASLDRFTDCDSKVSELAKKVYESIGKREE